MNSVGWPAALSALFLALVLTALPVPEVLAKGRPALVPLVMVYLCLSTPQRFGIFWAFALGLLLDVTYSTALGQHGLAMGVLAYVCLKLRGTIHLFPMFQQLLALIPIWAGYQGLLLWLDGVVGQSIDPSWRWIPALTTSLCWPLIAGYFALVEKPQHH